MAKVKGSCTTVKCDRHGVQGPVDFEFQGFKTKKLCPVCVKEMIEFFHDNLFKLEYFFQGGTLERS